MSRIFLRQARNLLTTWRWKAQTLLTGRQPKFWFSHQPPPTPQERIQGRLKTASHDMLERYKWMEEHMRYRGYNTLAILLSICGASGAFLYFNRATIRENISEEISGVTSRSLQHEEVVEKANELSKAVVQSILNDPEITNYASKFVVQVFSQPETREATAKLFQALMKDPETLKQTQLFFQWVISWLGKDPTTVKNLTMLSRSIIAMPETQAVCVDLVRQVMQDPATVQQVAELAAKILLQENVKQSANVLAADSAQYAMDSPTVQEKATQFMVDRLADTRVHEQGGQAIWSAVQYSMTPNFLSYKFYKKSNNDTTPISDKSSSLNEPLTNDNQG